MTTTATATPICTFLVVRHGQTDYNLEGRIQGQMDIPLNATGRKQAELLGRSLRKRCVDRGIKFKAIVSSPLQRAKATADALMKAQPDTLGKLELNLDPRLMERHLGNCQGLLVTDPKCKMSAIWEGYASLQKRAFAALQSIATKVKFSCTHAGGWVLVTCHGGVMHALATSCEGRKSSVTGIKNCCVATFDLTRGRRGDLVLGIRKPGFESAIEMVTESETCADISLEPLKDQN